MTLTMFKIRVRASRAAWLKRHEFNGMARYLRLEKYERRRNGTETYTNIHAIME